MNRRLLPLMILALLGLIAGGLLLRASFAGEAQLQGTTAFIDPDLIDALQNESEVKVLISLNDPDGPTGDWTTDLRRQRVAEIQAGVLDVLTNADFTLIHQFEIAAGISGRITQSGLDKLAIHPDVIAVGMVGQAGPGGGEGRVRVIPLLGASNRTHLSLCVDGADGFSVSDIEVQTVGQTLEAAFAGVPDLPSAYSQPAVTLGCSPPVALTGKPLDAHDRYSIADVPVRFITPPDVPSPHRLHVYFVPAEVYTASFGGDAYAVAAEERICEGDVCYPVTEGLYVTPAVTSDVLHRAVLTPFGLLPRVPDPTEYEQACLAWTPEQWCFTRDPPP